MAEPMTLAEFEREAIERMRLAQTPDSTMRYEQPADAVRYGLRPLILRLLAGERERCAQWHTEMAWACREMVKSAERPGDVIEDRMAAAHHEIAAAAIRAMGGPT